VPTGNLATSIANSGLIYGACKITLLLLVSAEADHCRMLEFIADANLVTLTDGVELTSILVFAGQLFKPEVLQLSGSLAALVGVCYS